MVKVHIRFANSTRRNEKLTLKDLCALLGNFNVIVSLDLLDSDCLINQYTMCVNYKNFIYSGQTLCDERIEFIGEDI